MKSNAKTRTRKMVICGLLLALSIVLKIVFEVYIPIGGLPTLRVNLTALPIYLSGIIAGPFFGLAVGALSDILCFLIKPSGPYFPGFTVVSALSGLLPGLIFMYKDKIKISFKWFNLIIAALFALVMVASGVFGVSETGITYDGKPVSTFFMVLMIVLLLGFAAFPFFYQKFSKTDDSSGYPVLFTVTVTQILCSIILNTWFLTVVYGQAASVLLPARVITNIFLIPFYSLVLTGILRLLSKKFSVV